MTAECPTMFHNLIHLVKHYVPHDQRIDFYKQLISVTGQHNIKLDFLLGEDELFDEAHRETGTG